MKLGAALTLIGLGLGAGFFIVNEGCGSDSSGTGGGSETGKVPPAEEGSPTSATDERVFAINSIWLGETDRAGNANKDAWKKFGYNLDGRITNVTDQKSPDLAKVCKRVSGAAATIHQDGDEGTDNVFGKEVLKLLGSITAAPSKQVTDSIIAGDFTVMLKVKGLTDDPAQTNTGLSGEILIGSAFSADATQRPTFTTSDDWPYLNDPKVPISTAYINKGTFVNGAGAQVRLSLSLSGQQLSLTINKALVTFKHNPGAKSLDEGTIAGVINTQEFVTGIAKVAGALDRSFCEGSTIEGVKKSIAETSDMLADGTQDPAKECDGISIGLGFTAKQVGTPTKEVTAGPASNPCDAPVDAGADASPNTSDAGDAGDAG